MTILFILFPLMYRGYSPILMSVIICTIATIFSMMMIGGLSTKTAAATIGTVFGVIASAVAAMVFGHFAGISGYNVSDIENLIYVQQVTSIKVGELLFSGIIISALAQSPTWVYPWPQPFRKFTRQTRILASGNSSCPVSMWGAT